MKKELSLVFHGRDVLTDSLTGDLIQIPQPKEHLLCQVSDRTRRSDQGEQSCPKAVEVTSDFIAPEGTSFKLMREFFAAHDEETSTIAARMKGLLNWRMSTKFCPSCGSPLEEHPTETALLCPSCGMVHYPRVEPCIITIVEKGDQILLLRHKLRNQDLWCCLAGFVEVGESLEHALIREIREETSLEVENIRYAGSQSWPFPDQLMVAFYADYKSGEFKLQEDEISEARWFPKDAIPASPQPGSISWRLIHFDF